jgi:DNA-binding CsgD family transcriptional regulator
MNTYSFQTIINWMRSESSDEGVHRRETKHRILELLLVGPKSAGEVADILHIQKSAARVHLESLQAEQNVKSRFKIERLGMLKEGIRINRLWKRAFSKKV